MARLDRLVTAKAVAQYAAVIGRQFAYDLLQAVSQLDEATLQRELGRLVEAEIVYQRGLPPQATYMFKHALIQDAAYQSLFKSTRQQYHQRIAQVLEAQFPEIAETQPELLAHHCTEAGLMEQAVGYWQKAGQQASERSAHVEAIAHLRQGLALLQALPETPERTQREVDLLIALGASLLAVKGFGAAEVGETYTYARHLCHHLDDPHQLFPVLRGLWHYYYIRAEYQTAHALGEQLLTLAQHVQDTAMLVAAHRAFGTTLYHLGAVAAAHTHFTQGMALYDPQQHRASVFRYGDDEGILCHSTAAWTLWYLGSPAQALARSHEAVTFAQEVAHPFSVGYALMLSAIFHSFRREVRVTQERAEATISIGTEQGFPQWKASGAILRGWTLAHQGQVKAGIEQLTQGLSAFRAMGAEINRSVFSGTPRRSTWHDGTARGRAHGAHGSTNACTHNRGTMVRSGTVSSQRRTPPTAASDNQAEAETCFHHALAIARHQQAKSLELRAATSLARLWQQQGKRQEAHDLLAPVYHWFTEGFDTLDLIDAKALLDALSEGR